MRELRWVVGVIGLLVALAGGDARADPIRWSFRAVEEPHEPFRTLSAAVVQNQGSFAVSPGQWVDLDLISRSHCLYSPHDPSDPQSVRDQITATVTLIDEASGASADFGVWVMAYEQWEYNPNRYEEYGGWNPLVCGYDSAREQGAVELGANRYEFWIDSGVMSVWVEPLATPEPATWVMALVGLAGLRRIVRQTAVKRR